MLTAVYGTANSDSHADIWKNHEAYSDGIAALGSNLSAIDAQIQIAQGNPGAADAKELARRSLCAIVCEVIGGVGAYAAVNAEPELAAKVDYSASNVTTGKTSVVVARCKRIHTTASEVVDKLGKFGITTAKLTRLKNAIAVYDGIKGAPRQHLVTKSAAAQLLPQLVRSGVAIVRDQLDGLMLQFKDAHPNFYNEYFAARAVVGNRAGNSKAESDSSTKLPGTGATSVSKAA